MSESSQGTKFVDFKRVINEKKNKKSIEKEF
jgi:hypothetical protein